MEDIFAKLYDMTAFSNIIADPSFLVMYAIAFILLYLGIKKHYEPLLLVPIAFGVLIANFPGGEMGVIQADENGICLADGNLLVRLDPDTLEESELAYTDSSPIIAFSSDGDYVLAATEADWQKVMMEAYMGAMDIASQVGSVME